MSQIFNSIKNWRIFRKNVVGSVGFVPTMGALHNAHLSLVDRSLNENDQTIVSIFVNPTQFNDPKDFEKYPNTLDQDISKLKSAGVNYILLPSYDELYADQYRYKISESRDSKILCGQSRPGHFDGVLTVVMKLLNIANADRAYFGEKDFQQLQLIAKMCSAFFLSTEIIACPTMREHDGLAMSSRNLLLSENGRKIAPLFHQELSKDIPIDRVISNLENHGFKIDYIKDYWGRRFGAVFLENVRLIDNVTIK